MAEKASELERSEFYLREGERLAHMGSWSLRPDGIFDYWSLNIRDFRVRPIGRHSYTSEMADRSASDDRDLVAKTLERIFREAFAST